MKRLSLTFFCLSVLFRLALGLSPTYSACQLQKAAGESPLTGCPEGTIYVSATDSAHSKFSSVQAAINSLPETGNATILIGAGEYHEKINVKRVAPLTLLGQLDPSTALIPGGNASQRNLVHIWDNTCVGYGAQNDDETAILTVFPRTITDTDFKFFNINFENRATARTQALSVSVTYARASFYGCTFASYQDTVYVGMEASVYMSDCVIFGSVDYFFGIGTCFVDRSILANRGCGGGITVWSSTPGQKNGIYIANSKIIRSWDVDPTSVPTGGCFLGRPWDGQYAIGVFHRNYMDSSINPAGFTGWSGDKVPDATFYAEFGSQGPGGSKSGRVSQVHILDAASSRNYGIEHVFPNRQWIDFAYKI